MTARTMLLRTMMLSRDEAWKLAVERSVSEVMPDMKAGYQAGFFDGYLEESAERNRLLDEIARLVAEIHALKVCVTDTEYAWHDLALAAKEYMDAEGAGGTFDAGRVREARARLKELVENPE